MKFKKGDRVKVALIIGDPEDVDNYLDKPATVVALWPDGRAYQVQTDAPLPRLWFRPEEMEAL